MALVHILTKMLWSSSLCAVLMHAAFLWFLPLCFIPTTAKVLLMRSCRSPARGCVSAEGCAARMALQSPHSGIAVLAGGKQIAVHFHLVYLGLATQILLHALQQLSRHSESSFPVCTPVIALFSLLP